VGVIDGFAIVNDGFGIVSDGFAIVSDGFGIVNDGFDIVNDGFGIANDGFGIANDGFGNVSDYMGVLDFGLGIGECGLARHKKTGSPYWDLPGFLGWVTELGYGFLVVSSTSNWVLTLTGPKNPVRVRVRNLHLSSK
jgi:hypothetical protein